MTEPPLQPWVREAARTLATTRIFSLESQRWHCPADPARSGEFAVINSPDWVNVFAVTPDQRVVLVEQFRFGVGIHSLEIPGGIVDPGEDPAATAARELLEETGYAGEPPIHLGSLSANAAILNNRFHTYFIGGAQRTGAQNLDEHEEMRVTTAPLAEFPRLIREGRVHHSVIVAAWALFREWNAARAP